MNPIVLTDEIVTGYQELVYTFTQISDTNRWFVNCNISTYLYNSKGKLIKELYTCSIDGMYTLTDGYIFISTRDLII